MYALRTEAINAKMLRVGASSYDQYLAAREFVYLYCRSLVLPPASQHYRLVAAEQGYQSVRVNFNFQRWRRADWLLHSHTFYATDDCRQG